MMQRKKSNGNGVKFFCENVGSIHKSSTGATNSVNAPSYKNSLEKRPGGKKMSEGLARFFYRRGKLY